MCLRWPLVTAVLIGTLLFYLLQPQSDVVHRIKGPILPNYLPEPHVILSPSGRYLAYRIHHLSAIQLYDLHQREVVFEHDSDETVVDYQFDTQDGLAFSSTRWKDNSKQISWYWQPGQDQPKETNSLTKGNEAFKTLMMLDSIRLPRLQVSPDGRTWLKIWFAKGTLHCELLDSKTGILRANLGQQIYAEPYTFISRLNVQFSSDSSKLAIQLSLDYDEQSSLQVFDSSTGKPLSHVIKLPQVIDAIVQMDEQRIAGFSSIDNGIYWQNYTRDSGYRQVLLPESVRDISHLPPNTDARVYPHSARPVEFKDGKLTLCWNHGNGPMYFQGCLGTAFCNSINIGFYDSTTGKMLNHWQKGNADVDDDSLNDWKLHTILPDHQMLLQKPMQRRAKWLNDIEAWRLAYASWLPNLVSPRNVLEILDTRTGATPCKLSFSSENVHGFYHQATNTLCIASSEPGELILRQYSLPLHAPWQLICLWSVLTFLLLSAWQYYRHANRRAVASTTQMAPA